jgi:Pyruvate/2-oxoacid:ferredoxin oxidoreductase gamma subunit
MPAPRLPGVALLVDFDNLSIGAGGTGTKGATHTAIAVALRTVAARFGNVTVARVYASTRRNMRGLVSAFVPLGYEVVSGASPTTNPDIRMALDGAALLFNDEQIETYVIASGDSDFAPLADNFLAAKKHLVVVAPRLVTSGVLKAKAHEFIALEDILPKTDGQILDAEDVKRLLHQYEPSKQRRPLPKPKPTIPRPMLRVFLCHSKRDKPAVRKLYERLRDEEGIKPWLDEHDLLAGQDWKLEITKEVRNSHCVLVCLSKKAMDAEGFVHKEIKFALDANDHKPEGTIYLIPVKFEACEVPERISQFQWVDLFEPSGYANLMRSLRQRANGLEQAPRS